MEYNDYFTQAFCEEVIHFLKKECKIERGFYSQIVGKKQIISATSSSIIYYVLNSLGELTTTEKEQAVLEILSFKQTEEGFYKNAVGISNNITTWGTAQACMALITLGCKEEDYIDILEWLCSVQKLDGGWSYDGKEDNESHILYCFYIIQSLIKYKGNNSQVSESLEKAKKYIHDFEALSISEKVLKLFLIDYLNIRKIYEYEKTKMLYEFTDMILQNNLEDTLTESSQQGHFYINFYFNSYYLLLRRFVEPDNLISIYLMNQIHNNIKEKKGWSNRNSDKSKAIYSWATALTILVVKLWNTDCKKKKIDILKIKDKLENIEKGDLEITMFMQKCPLNGGQCNKIADIKKQYSDKNIFLDIPYHNKYKTFENQIIKTVECAGLNKVVAKQTQKTNMILCKVCFMIQTCKYGVADISYETLNVPFELGLMYGLGKDCAILKASDAKQPTDIEGIEYIEYENTDELNEGLASWIRDNVK